MIVAILSLVGLLVVSGAVIVLAMCRAAAAGERAMQDYFAHAEKEHHG